jgi:hypothetical protein
VSISAEIDTQGCSGGKAARPRAKGCGIVGLPFNGIDLNLVRNAIGDALSYADMKAVMDQVHGEGTINECASDAEPRRIVADKCMDYSRRHGMLDELFISVANRTDAQDPLRLRLVDTLRKAFAQYEDVAPPLVALVASWPQSPLPPTVMARISRDFRLFFVDAADSLERPEVLKAMREAALAFDQYSRTVSALLEREEVLSDFFIETSVAHADALEKAAAEAAQLLGRLVRPQPTAIEARWVGVLHSALDAYRAALAVKNFDAIRSARNVLTHLLEATAPRIGEDLFASAATLSFERVAVVLRDIAKISGLAAATAAIIAPSILHCLIALPYRREVYRRWSEAFQALADLRGMVPADPDPGDEVWLVTVSDGWPAVHTTVRTLCLLVADGELQQRERELADSVGDAIAALVQRSQDAQAELKVALAGYAGFATERAAANGAALERELDKLAELRRILHAIRAALP